MSKKRYKILRNKPIKQELQVIPKPQPLNQIHPHEQVEISLSFAFNTLFSQFRLPEMLELNNFSILSTIIYKLTASYTQLKALEIKNKELLIKEENHQFKKNLIAQLEIDQKNAKGFTPEALRLIEQQLKLL